MAITEETRHHLYRRLEEVLGSEEASTLMEHLPPVGWADVATRRDLDHAETALRSDMEKMKTGIRSDMEKMGLSLEARLERELRVMTWRLVGALITVASVAVAAGRAHL